ncbi:MAG: arginase family protein [Hyphomicrobiaceae bacterium]
MSVSLIYAYWPNRPFGMTWCDLPWALREAGLPERLHQAGHEVVETTVYAEGDDGEELRGGFELARNIGRAVKEARSAYDLPVVLCGSCSVAAVGTLCGGLGGADTGVLWCDAHPDLNTPETSTSGLFEGMALAVAAGRAWQALSAEAGLTPVSLAHTVLFGARDIDAAEQTVLSDKGVPVARDAKEVNARLSGSRQTYVHLDMDVHDALEVRTNQFAVENGPSVSTVRDVLTGCDRLSALAVTGLDPSANGAKEAFDVAIDHVLAVAVAWCEGAYNA